MNQELIHNSLNLNEGYYINNINIEEDSRSIYIDIAYDKTTVTCPLCMNKSAIHDRLQKKWRHVNVEDYKVFICFKTPRVKCKQHGVKLSNVSWAKPKQQVTTSLEQFVCDLAKDMNFSQIARELDEHDTRIRRIILRSKNEENNI